MAISRQRKKDIVTEYKELMSRSQAVILTSYSGLSVRDTEKLRRRIGEVGGEFHIVKNRLMSRAFEEVGLPLPEGGLQGTTAMGFAMEDIPAVAKIIVDLTRENEGLKVKGGVVEGLVYDLAQVERIADLPPVPVLRAQLLSTLQAPAGGVVGIIAASMRQIVNLLQAQLESLEGAEASAEPEQD